MSVHLNTYVMLGALLPYAAFKSDGWHDRLEPYMDNAFNDLQHYDGLCVLWDGMNGKYVAIGKVLAKSDNHQGFAEPIVLNGLAPAEVTELYDKIKAIIPPGLSFKVQRLVISHYR